MDQHQEYIKQQILELIQVSEERYFFFQVDMAQRYLRNVACLDSENASIMQKSALFWEWFLGHWYTREEELLNSLHPDVDNPGEYYFHKMEGEKHLWDHIETFPELVEFWEFYHSPVRMRAMLTKTFKDEIFKEVTGLTWQRYQIKELKKDKSLKLS